MFLTPVKKTKIAPAIFETSCDRPATGTPRKMVFSILQNGAQIHPEPRQKSTSMPDPRFHSNNAIQAFAAIYVCGRE
jgi:hypothetical protein